jgi:hypothetical protein
MHASAPCADRAVDPFVYGGVMGDCKIEDVVAVDMFPPWCVWVRNIDWCVWVNRSIDKDLFPPWCVWRNSFKDVDLPHLEFVLWVFPQFN